MISTSHSIPSFFRKKANTIQIDLISVITRGSHKGCDRGGKGRISGQCDGPQSKFTSQTTYRKLPATSGHQHASSTHTKYVIYTPMLTTPYTIYTLVLCKMLFQRGNQGISTSWPFCVYMYVCVDMCTTMCIWRSEDNLWTTLPPWEFQELYLGYKAWQQAHRAMSPAHDCCWCFQAIFCSCMGMCKYMCIESLISQSWNYKCFWDTRFLVCG